MKKRIISIALLVLMIIPVVSSCLKFKDDNDKKYDYELSDYITLPSDYKDRKLDLELDALQAAIDTYLLKAVQENSDGYKYKVSRGDDIYVDINVYDELIITSENTDAVITKKGNKIDALSKSNYLIENLGSSPLPYAIELDLINGNLNIKDVLERKYSYDKLEDFIPSEYEGKNIWFDIKILNKKVELGDVVSVAYKGYHVDEVGNKAKDENGKEKDPFDSSTGAFFFPGTKLAIDDFENNLVGMKLNEQFSFYATFPDDYSEEEFKGKRVLFEVTINNVYTPPVYNSNFIKTWFPDYSSRSEFEASLKKEFIMTKMYDYVLENAVVKEYPEAEYNLHKAEIEEASASFEEYYGYTFDEYIKKAYNMTRDEYIKSQMLTEMVYYTVSKENGLIPTEEMLTNEKQNLISYYKALYMQQQGLDEKTALDTATSFVNNLGESYIYENVMYNMVEEFLYKCATVTELPATYESITTKIAREEAVTQ
ncbi:MAG: FKBP-type peptidyl-prolyl cis-trans isomerase [Clostridia bacterium]|nr:FKBP-type peptidyl-prolyl cis-trans isomerase [Clostridia bacterium]